MLLASTAKYFPHLCCLQLSNAFLARLLLLSLRSCQLHCFTCLLPLPPPLLLLLIKRLPLQ
jgi:hypothetical protein